MSLPSSGRGMVKAISSMDPAASRGLNSGHIVMGLTCGCLSAPNTQKDDYVLDKFEEPTEAEREPDPLTSSLDTPGFPDLVDYISDMSLLPKGRLREPDGTEYEGELRGGVKHGSGRETLVTGEYYVGEFQLNSRHGQGLCRYPDGRVYEGAWVTGRETGQGVMKWPDERRYSGEFEDGVRSGFGVFEWGDGRKYAGNWLRDMQHGDGTFTSADGDVVTGKWVRGKRTCSS